MKNHLLSLFPLKHDSAYVRVSCIAIEEPVVPCRSPFTLTRQSLVKLLATTSFREHQAAIMTALDDGFDVQLSISDEDARAIGGQPKLN